MSKKNKRRNKSRVSHAYMVEVEQEKLRLEKEKLELAKRKAIIEERTLSLIAESQSKNNVSTGYVIPEIMEGVVPKGETPAIAQDSYTNSVANYAQGFVQFYGNFLGYPKLAMLTQSTDYRCVYETTSSELTREWGQIKSTTEDDDKIKEKIKKLEERFKQMDIKSLIRKQSETEMIFGRSQIFIDIKGHSGKLDLPLLINPKSIQKDSLERFTIVEPMWSTPSNYNASKPLEEDFYVPDKWYVMGEIVHKDRLITMISRPVPDLLKAAYNFSGISMIQLMEPYVQRWERTVDSVSTLIHSFSMTGLKTNMANILADGDSGYELLKRAQLFSSIKDNQQLMLLDNNEEEFFQFNTPLSSLDSLLQKSQEQMAAPSHTPLVKLIGVTPSGMNASSKEEISVYQDYISAFQENHLIPQIKIILDILQLDMFGEIDPSLFFEFNPLEQMSEEQLATLGKAKAERDATYIEAGVISQEEVRGRLSKEEHGDYTGIDVDDIPNLQDDDGQTLEEKVNGFEEESNHS